MKKELSIVQEDSYLLSYRKLIEARIEKYQEKKKQLLGSKRKVSTWANGHLYYGVQFGKRSDFVREWAPNATAIYLVGDFNNWEKREEFALSSQNYGNWELELPKGVLEHGQFYKLLLYFDGQEKMRVPSYASYVVQNPETKEFCSKIWNPHKKFKFRHPYQSCNEKPLLIYEAHVGMATESDGVGSYREFRETVLPRIKQLGYNAIQLMAVQEHPYYGSFGYQVSNFYAPSSRFGTPDELKELIDTAHSLGIAVILDIVHSHAVGNEGEGLNNFDGTEYQYFHEGARGNHPAWKTKCFNYGSPSVLHFLLSNCHYWIDQFHFDGIRFDGVTSMLYKDHGLERTFSSYDDYFNENVDEEALIYFMLANELLNELRECPISIAEEMSGMPGLAYPLDGGGFGFSHRLSMGIPDFWIKLIKEHSDEQWDMDQLYYELTNVRWNEGAINYCESHDQAMVGDKTIIFRLADKEMYEHFSKATKNDIVDRAIALHKMIRAITMITAKDGYLNFMGNEFGHPEWIDFPREGNDWSYHYARRQWSLLDNKELCYEYLWNFEKSFLSLCKEKNLFEKPFSNKIHSHNDHKILIIERSSLIFIFNFHPSSSYTDYPIYMGSGKYREIFDSDREEFGGFSRLEGSLHHSDKDGKLFVYLPCRSMVVLKKV